MDVRKRCKREGRQRRYRNHLHNNPSFRGLSQGPLPAGYQPDIGFSHAPASILWPGGYSNFAILPHYFSTSGLENPPIGHPTPPVNVVSLDMLGAQARAAELQAAKSAAMRQRAHRDAEDNVLPPDSAPVSLTDFVRNPLLNKNKGVKAFRPLVDSDFEASNLQTDPQSSSSDSPFTDNPQSALPGSAPLAPRAMLGRSGSYSSKMTPSRVRAPVFTPRLQPTDSVTKALAIQDTHMSASPYPRLTPNASGHVFGPDDLSPTKQELKLAEMRYRYDNLHEMQSPIHHLPTPSIPDARFYTPQQSYQHNPHPLYSDTQMQQPPESYAYSRPLMHHYDSETGASATGYGQAQTHVERTQIFADDLMNHQHRLQQQSRILEPTKQSLSLLDREQPYDRNSKMQSFVAAQQAMARRGKTVLHNPDLHKSPQLADPYTADSYSSMGPTPSPIHPQTKPSGHKHESSEDISHSRQSIKFEDKAAILRAVLKRNNGLAGQSQGGTVSYQAQSVPTLANDIRVEADHCSYETKSDDWCTLRPVAAGARAKMLHTIRRMNRETPSSSPSNTEVPLANSFQSLVGINTENWLRETSGDQSIRRLALEKVVDEHEKRVSRGPMYGIIGKPVIREKTDFGSRGALKAVARIMAVLYDAADEHRKSPSKSQYTTTPAYAIDRDAALNPSGASLFDDIGFPILSSETRGYC